jgi:hypothetical protein
MLSHFRLGHPNLVYLENLFPTLFNKKPRKMGSLNVKQIIHHTMFVKHSLEGKVTLFIVGHIVITGDDYEQITHLKKFLAREL